MPKVHGCTEKSGVEISGLWVQRWEDGRTASVRQSWGWQWAGGVPGGVGTEPTQTPALPRSPQTPQPLHAACTLTAAEAGWCPHLKAIAEEKTNHTVCQ